MRVHLLVCLFIVGLSCIKAEAGGEEKKSDVTKLEIVDLSEAESDSETKESEVQRRESGYSYNRPHHFALSSRSRVQVGQAGYKARIINKHSGQIHRPVNKYGPPSHQQGTSIRPGSPSQQHHDKLHQHGHFMGNQQHSGNFNNRPTLLQQEVPSPIRHVDFVEPNPIASQNNQPFGSNSANYLPPSNQKLPAYAPPDTFSSQQALQITQGNGQGHRVNLQQSQNLVQSQQNSISDAALFLSQNAQAIQQLYGAQATEQDFAPNNNEFVGHTNQVQNTNAQLQNFESSSQSPQSFPGPLPSYASGTLNPQETLQQIQSLEKDRLIVQLQRALATQNQNIEAAGRYAQNQASFVQNQDLLASLGQQMKIQGLNTQQSTLSFGTGNTAFNQSPFLPGTTISPAQFPLNYGLSTTTQAPTITTTASTVPPQQPTRGDGTSQVGTSLPLPSQPGSPTSPPSTGFPVYGGFVPTILTGTSFFTGVPTYGTSLLTPGAVTTTVQTSGSTPTHFGIPIPTEGEQKPSTSSPPSTSASTPSALTPSRPSAPVIPSAAVPLPPVHPVTSLHPVSTVFRPAITPIQPLTPLRPVVPATPAHVHPVQTPSTTGTVHPTYGLQTPVVNPVLFKPVKPVYPLYYYPNVVYQLQKPVVPTYPWSYAPSYAQTKPAQIWK